MTKGYEEGLRFRCSRCGKCCTGEPGTVKVSEPEIRQLAKWTGFNESRFREDYTRSLDDGFTRLRERQDGSCVFYDSRAGCTVYGARPLQCRTYPFWQRNLESSRSWAIEALACPGIGRGDLLSAETIEASSRKDGTLSAARRSRYASDAGHS
jgi:Fe-S-cluster containining protein